MSVCRSHHHSTRRLRHLLVSSCRRWLLLLVLTAFVATNCLLYRGLNRASASDDGRSVDPRTLRVISIGSWQPTDGHDDADAGNGRWDVYIDSPRQFQRLSGSKQRERSEVETGANGAAAPAVRYIRRGGQTNTEVDRQRLNFTRANAQGVLGVGPGEKAGKPVNIGQDYRTAVYKSRTGRTGLKVGGFRQRASTPRGAAFARRPKMLRNLVSVQSAFNQSRMYPSPIKLKNRISKPARPVSTNSRREERRALRPPIPPAESDVERGGVPSNSRPPWLSDQDAETLRRLANNPIAGFQSLSPHHAGKLGLGVLVYELESNGERGAAEQGGRAAADGSPRCGEPGVACALLFPPSEIHRVAAFHLDRVLGFGRALPTVSRGLPAGLRRRVGLPADVDVKCPLMLYEPGLYVDAELAELSREQLSDCLAGVEGTEGLDWCNNVLTENWGAVALFDFLLQIYHRLDFGCCGLDATERRRRCSRAALGRSPAARHLQCPLNSDRDRDRDSGGGIGCNYRLASGETDRLVLVENLVDFVTPADKLDMWILRGINSFPASAVALIREGRLRPMLLQSLSTDKGYWEGQGGRAPLEKLLGVIDERGKVFLQHIGSTRE